MNKGRKMHQWNAFQGFHFWTTHIPRMLSKDMTYCRGRGDINSLIYWLLFPSPLFKARYQIRSNLKHTTYPQKARVPWPSDTGREGSSSEGTASGRCPHKGSATLSPGYQARLSCLVKQDSQQRVGPMQFITAVTSNSIHKSVNQV